ncbi:MAG: hypothetical protein V3T39_08430, partial [Gammaproteobacteria bacterium]
AKAVVKKYAQPLDAGDFQATEGILVSFNAANDNFDWMNQAGTNSGVAVDAESLGIIPNDTTTIIQTNNLTIINTAIDVEGHFVTFGGGKFSFNGKWSMEKVGTVCGLGSGATEWNFTNTAVDAIEIHGNDVGDKRKQTVLCGATITMTGTQASGFSALHSRAPLQTIDIEIGVKGSSSKFSVGCHGDGVSTIESAAEQDLQLNVINCSSHGLHFEGNVAAAQPRDIKLDVRLEECAGTGLFINGANSTPEGMTGTVLVSTNTGIGADISKIKFSSLTIKGFSNNTAGSNTDVSIGSISVDTCRFEIAQLTTNASTNLVVTTANLIKTPVLFGNTNYGSGIVGGFRGARLSKTSAQAVTGSVITVVTWDAELFDTDAFFTIGTSTTNIVVPAGLDFAFAKVGVLLSQTDVTGQWAISILQNGTEIAELHTETSATDHVSFDTGPISISAGDIFTASCFPGTTSSITTQSRFWIEILGAA